MEKKKTTIQHCAYLVTGVLPLKASHTNGIMMLLYNFSLFGSVLMTSFLKKTFGTRQTEQFSFQTAIFNITLILDIYKR